MNIHIGDDVGPKHRAEMHRGHVQSWLCAASRSKALIAHGSFAVKEFFLVRLLWGLTAVMKLPYFYGN
jgi:hypothetical protein